MSTQAESFQHAVTAYHAGRLQDAEALCRQLLGANPSYFHVLSLLEKVFSAQGQPAAVIPFYQAALTQDQEFIQSRSTYGGLLRLKALGFNPKAILDIGAYAGDWMRTAKTVFPKAKVLMVEAQSDKDSYLKAACNGFAGSVEYVIALLGRDNREAVSFYQMSTPFGSTGSSLYEEQTAFDRQIVTLPMCRLDDFLAAHSDSHFQLIKLDVQGAELDVLSGGQKTLQAAEIVLLEASFIQYNKGAPLFDEVIAFMKADGFVVFDILDCFRAKQDILFQGDILFVRKDSPLRPAGLFKID